MEKGTTNNPNGRPKGSLNKRTELVIEIIEQSRLSPIDFDLAVLNWDLGILGLSEEQIKEIDTRTQLELRQKASDALKPHAYPKLKATEISIDKDSGNIIQLNYTPKGKNNGGQ